MRTTLNRVSNKATENAQTKHVFKLLLKATNLRKNRKYSPHKFAEMYSQIIDTAEHSISNKGFELPGAFSHGPLQNINNLLKSLYSGKYASLSFGGSSGTLLTLLIGVLPKLKPDRKLVLFDGNCHQSTIGGLIFGRWKAIRIPREIHEKHGTVDPVKLSQVKEIVQRHGAENFAAIILVLPSYDGFRAKIEEAKIFAYAKSQGITVIVDGAWDAACFRRRNAEGIESKRSADVWISSPHKRGLCPSSLGCMITDDRQIAILWDAALNLGFRSSSISFVDTMVAEHRLTQIVSGEWEGVFQQAELTAKVLRQRMSEVHRYIYVVQPHHVDASSCDLAHILINTSNLSNFDARIWAKTLSDQFNFDVEKSTRNTLLLLCAIPLDKQEIDMTLDILRRSLLSTIHHIQVAN